MGIFVEVDGVLSKVVSRGSPIPEGNGSFFAVRGLAVSGASVAFRGVHTDGQDVTVKQLVKIIVEATYLAEGARANELAPYLVGQIYFRCALGTTTWLDASGVRRYGAIPIDVTPHVEWKVWPTRSCRASTSTCTRLRKRRF